nr:unnamed protein product [Spirometra erinaceieuropaei]
MELSRGTCSDQRSGAGLRLRSTLFSLMFFAMLMGACRDGRPEVRIACRTDSHLLNNRRIHLQSLVSTTTVNEHLSANNCTLNAISEEDMQRRMYLFSAACENLGLAISTKKTLVMHQSPPNTAHNALQISVNGT